MHPLYSALAKHGIRYTYRGSSSLSNFSQSRQRSFLRSTAQTRPSRFQLDGSRSRQKHIPPSTCRLSVSSSASASVCRPAVSTSVLAARFLFSPRPPPRPPQHLLPFQLANPTKPIRPNTPPSPPTSRPPSPNHTDDSTTAHIRASPERSPTSCRSSSPSRACQTKPNGRLQ
jgi:hypothetical protein